MKIDTTTIAGYEEMTAEEKVKALELFEIADPKDGAESDAIKRYKSLVDKATAEASEYKKKYRESLSDAERKEMERAEKEKKMSEELKSYKDKERVSNYTALFMGVGYDEETAKRLASTLPEGMTEDFFLAQKEFISAERKKMAIKNINSAPQPTVGAPMSGNDTRDALDVSLKKYFGL